MFAKQKTEPSSAFLWLADFLFNFLPSSFSPASSTSDVVVFVFFLAGFSPPLPKPSIIASHTLLVGLATIATTTTSEHRHYTNLFCHHRYCALCLQCDIVTSSVQPPKTHANLYFQKKTCLPTKPKRLLLDGVHHAERGTNQQPSLTHGSKQRHLGAHP